MNIKKIQNLIKRFKNQRDTYKQSDYNETQTRIEFINPLFIAFWAIKPIWVLAFCVLSFQLKVTPRSPCSLVRRFRGGGCFVFGVYRKFRLCFLL